MHDEHVLNHSSKHSEDEQVLNHKARGKKV